MNDDERESHRRKQAIYLFLAVYIGFMLLLIVLEMIQNHDRGFGLV